MANTTVRFVSVDGVPVPILATDNGDDTYSLAVNSEGGGGASDVNVAQIGGNAVTTTIPVSGTVTVTGVATAANQSSELTLVGALTETAPATDTASSGLNGRLQRIAQRLTSLIALLPASLGQKTMANSLAVTVASDQSAVPTSSQAATLNDAGSGTDDEQAIAGAANLRCMGFNIQESAVVPAVADVVIRHGTDATGPVIAQVKLIASGSQTIWFGPNGITVTNGVFLERVAGTTQVTVYSRVQA